MRETRYLEFKEDITNSFLKTVSAFANYDGGEIIFGLNDGGEMVGLKDVKGAALQIENKINDSIEPNPNYEIKIEDNIIRLIVKPGLNKPYLYKSKAYKRNDTSTIEVDNMELKRMILAGANLSYEELPSAEQDLTFAVLEKALIETIQIDKLDTNILKTLNLYSDQKGYNRAAGLLADKSIHPGVDVAVFGDSISIIKKRQLLENISVLELYTKVMGLYRDNYQYEVIASAVRSKVEEIPEQAFREVLANALIHRLWDMPVQIRISMYPDKIEVISPGGLPQGIKVEEYLKGELSYLRNPILSNVFFRLKLAEVFGTGIKRIRAAYVNSESKPQFEVSSNYIKVVLPVLKQRGILGEDEQALLEVLDVNTGKSMAELSEVSGFGRSKIYRLLKDMMDANLVMVKGKQRGTKYYKVM